MIEIIRIYNENIKEKKQKVKHMYNLFKLTPDEYQIELMLNKERSYITTNFKNRRDGSTTAALMRAIQIADLNEDINILVIGKNKISTFEIGKLLKDNLRGNIIYRHNKILYKNSRINLMTIDDVTKTYKTRGHSFNHIIIDGVYYDNMNAVIKEVEPCILYSLGRIEVLLKNRGE